MVDDFAHFFFLFACGTKSFCIIFTSSFSSTKPPKKKAFELSYFQFQFQFLVLKDLSKL